MGVYVQDLCMYVNAGVYTYVCMFVKASEGFVIYVCVYARVCTCKMYVHVLTSGCSGEYI